jgi:PadR family transcriptional regulator PadR
VEHSSQLLKGVLDMCLLALIAEEPSYGYEMVDKLEHRGLELVSEGSIYPLLSRLSREGLISSEWVESRQGPPRKYYNLTDDGREAYRVLQQEFALLRELVARASRAPDHAVGADKRGTEIEINKGNDDDHRDE